MKTVFIAGYARLPSGMAAKNMYETLTSTAEIEKKYGVIVSTSSTVATDHGREFVQYLLKGHSLQDGIDQLLEEIKLRSLGQAGHALQPALKDLYKQYGLYRRERHT